MSFTTKIESQHSDKDPLNAAEEHCKTITEGCKRLANDVVNLGLRDELEEEKSHVQAIQQTLSERLGRPATSLLRELEKSREHTPWAEQKARNLQTAYQKLFEGLQIDKEARDGIITTLESIADGNVRSPYADLPKVANRIFNAADALDGIAHTVSQNILAKDLKEASEDLRAACETITSLDENLQEIRAGLDNSQYELFNNFYNTFRPLADAARRLSATRLLEENNSPLDAASKYLHNFGSFNASADLLGRIAMKAKEQTEYPQQSSRLNNLPEKMEAVVEAARNIEALREPITQAATALQEAAAERTTGTPG